MLSMATAMSNKPIAIVILAACLQGYLMAYIPILPWRNLHAAHMANTIMPQENIGPHLCGYTNTFHY